MRVLEAIGVDNRGLSVISKVGLTLLLTLSIPRVTSGCFITFGIFSELESVLDVLGVGLRLPKEELLLLPKPFLFLCTKVQAVDSTPKFLSSSSSNLWSGQGLGGGGEVATLTREVGGGACGEDLDCPPANIATP